MAKLFLWQKDFLAIIRKLSDVEMFDLIIYKYSDYDRLSRRGEWKSNAIIREFKKRMGWQ